MHRKLILIATTLVAALSLAACLMAPGKFTSHLTLRQDGTFTFTYVGEIVAQDVDSLSTMKVKDAATDAEADPKARAEAAARKEAERRALAVTLMKEAGYNRVEYRGNDTWFVDYRATGKLTHTFLFPYSLDSEVVFPFLAIEPRANGTLRVKAPGFAASKGPGELGMMGEAAKGNARLDGTFTLDTDAAIVSQNSEAGANPSGAMQRIVWRATPMTKDAPMATVRIAPAR